MSRVFLATERALDRRVVIKVLPPELSAGVNVERFKREIQLAAQLQHPHIVPLLATGDQDGILWFSMPFIEGHSLRGALTQQRRMPARDVVRVLHDVVDALSYAHSRGVVHRDIKPDNILTSGMHALVTDFGVAKALSAASPMVGGTTTGMAIGTPAYMAPEQLAADPAADHRVDIYAVGLLAYELLTGKSPFSGSSPQATMAAQLTEVPTPPHQFADIPQDLSVLIMHCLEKDSAKRPQSAQALLADLEALPAMPSSVRTAAPPRRRKWTVAMGAIAALAVTMVIAQQVRERKRETTASADSLSARDAAAGGDRSPRAPLGTVAARKSTADAVRPETVVVFRSENDAQTGLQVPVVISRAESLAIAAAVRARMIETAKNPISSFPAATSPKTTELESPSAARTMTGNAIGVLIAPTSAPAPTSGAGGAASATRIVLSADGQTVTMDRAALLAEVGKIFADSVARAFGRIDTAMARAARVYQFEMPRPTGRAVTPLLAPPSDGRTRVVVTNFTNSTSKRENFQVGADIARALREALPRETYDVVDDETTNRASRALGDPSSIGFGLRADFIVTGFLSQRGDSLMIVTLFNDVRDGRYSRVASAMTAAGEQRKAFDAQARQVSAWLDTARVLRSRRPPNVGRSGSSGRGEPPFVFRERPEIDLPPPKRPPDA